MVFTLPPLPYFYGALEPLMDARTVEIHYTKHHQGYVNGLNKIVVAASKEVADKSLEELIKDLNKLPESLRNDVHFFGGGIYNHTLFWESMKPAPHTTVDGKLLEVITSDFTSLEVFKKAFFAAATDVRGSGWCWLVIDKKGALSIKTTQNHDCPLSAGFVPLLVVDIWEHAYYLCYQNRRADFLTAWWNLINWEKIEERYAKAMSALMAQK